VGVRAAYAPMTVKEDACLEATNQAPDLRRGLLARGLRQGVPGEPEAMLPPPLLHLGGLCPDEVPESHVCTNRHGAQFQCSPDSSCCGDICVGAGGACCKNRYGNNFACGKGSSCCGDVCAAPGSKCCVNKHGTHYPVTQATKCVA